MRQGIPPEDMKSKFSSRMDDLLQNEDAYFKRLNDIVIQAIEEEKLISEKICDIEDRTPPFSSRIADKIARFGGSWTFILSFLLLMTVWVVINIVSNHPFDAYPFILLNLLLSTIAALQAPIILMSQNRKEEKDRQRAVNDYMVNLKAEIEIRNMHQKLDLLIAEQMKTLFELQNVQVEMIREIKDIIDGGGERSQNLPGTKAQTEGINTTAEM